MDYEYLLSSKGSWLLDVIGHSQKKGQTKDFNFKLIIGNIVVVP